MAKLSLGVNRRLFRVSEYYGSHQKEVLALLRVEFLAGNEALVQKDGTVRDEFFLTQECLFMNGGGHPLFVSNLRSLLRWGMGRERRRFLRQYAGDPKVALFPTFLGVSPNTARRA